VVQTIAYRVDPDTLHRVPADTLALNDIGRVTVESFRPLVCDAYDRNRATGSFILVDPRTNATVAAGMVLERGEGRPSPAAPERNLTPTAGQVTAADRARLTGQRPVTVWLTGLSASGKSTLAYALEAALAAAGRLAYVLDGDNLRHGVSSDLGFAAKDRTENIRRAAEVARLLNDAGVIVVASFISPFRQDRARARAIVGPERFLEVFVDAPVTVCAERDPKGLYRRAMAGDLPEFTGVTAPYEAPEAPEVRVPTAELGPEEAVTLLLRTLRTHGAIG
jgi:bifunctional enzyme CysN/CysC